MLRTAQFAAALLLAGLLTGAAAADDLEELRAKLAREDDPADRAKITVKIGEALLKQAAKDYKGSDYEAGDQVLSDYRQAIHTAYDDLQSTGLDARRKPKGFKHLEIHLRKSRRRLADMGRALPFGARAAVEQTMEEMETLRLELLSALMRVDLGQPDDGPEGEQNL